MTCTGCGGSGGHTETSTENGVYREHWVSCPTCHGTGHH